MRLTWLERWIFGRDYLAALDRLFFWGTIALLAAFFAGIWIAFAAAPWLAGAGGYALAVLAALSSLALLIVPAWRGGRLKSPPRAGHWLMLAFLPLLIAVPFVPVVTKLVPGVLTSWLGEPFSETHAMRTRAHGGPRRLFNCEFRLEGGPMRGFFATHLCIDRDTYVRHPDEAVVVVLGGRRSVFGRRIETIEVVAAAAE